LNKKFQYEGTGKIFADMINYNESDFIVDPIERILTLNILPYEKLSIPPNVGYLNYSNNLWIISDKVGYTDTKIINNYNILNNNIINTSNNIINITNDINFEINILENILLPPDKTFLDHDEKIIHLCDKNRVSLNYPAITDDFIIPLKQVDKIIDNNNAVAVLDYLINRPFLYVVGNIIQVNDTYSMIREIVAYVLNNNNTTFSFTKKLSIINELNI